ncbi:MAG: hypothetical protein LBS84_12550 [Clostridiales bacterium]|jgi:hypothetical protein|nr:hypothetical protein [Clostridiales bacterium]
MIKTVIKRNSEAAAVIFGCVQMEKKLAVCASPPESVEIHIAPREEWPCSLKPQGYRINTRGNNVIATAADESGAMYAALDIMGHFAAGASTAELTVETVEPYIEKRGIKFNIPLDARTPSYTDSGGSAQENISDMWDMDFWHGFLDRMALNKFNVLSLWNLSPGPSLVRVPEYPAAALDNVTRADHMPCSDLRGLEMYTSEQRSSLTVIKYMTMDEKIRFWREVMAYAKDRCVDVYIFTWNIFIFGAEDTGYGFTDSLSDPITADYIRCTIKSLVSTYPLLAGIGVTAGENMRKDWKEDVREDIEWIRATYGQGIIDALSDEPGRPFTLIHRSHMTSVARMEDIFADFPYNFELSFKYSMAHIHSAVKPGFGDAFFKQLKNGRKTWLTLRDDDFYMLRWADPAFARDYILNMPKDLIRGFYLGPDGIIWGREYDLRDESQNGSFYMDRHFCKFNVWGRIAYQPDYPEKRLLAGFTERFADKAENVYRALSLASTAIPIQQRVYWHDFDFQWYPEASCSYLQEEEMLIFHTLNDFIRGKACPGANTLSINEYVDQFMADSDYAPGNAFETPVMAAGNMIRNCESALEYLDALDGKRGFERDFIEDIKAMANLGLYYAHKILAATELLLYRRTSAADHKESAVMEAEKAYGCWRVYSASISQRYRPLRLSRLRSAVSPDMFNGCARFDIAISQEGLSVK